MTLLSLTLECLKVVMISKDSEITDITDKELKKNSDEILELIHTTSHSLLYRMRRDGKYFIVKQSASSDENGRKILRREYEISIGLFHPNIVDVYEYRYDENYNDSIIMEYVEGRTLSDFLTENPSLKTKKRIYSEILDAIEYLHLNRIIHNDIKPENIIVSRTGDRVKLIDLGLSDDDVHYALRSIGFTRGFSAPELINQAKADVRSDLYSLGIISRLLFGNRYRGLTRKCIRTNPEKRFQNVAEIKRYFNNLYLSRLIPAIGLGALLITFLIMLGIKDIQTQKKERDLLKNEINLQNQELNRQKASFLVLQDTYKTLNDSILDAERKRKEKEELKRETVEKFTFQLQRITNLALDSLRRSTNYFEMSAIRLNYQKKAALIYENQNKIADGEDLTPLFNSILTSETGKVDKEFDSILQKGSDNQESQRIFR